MITNEQWELIDAKYGKLLIKICGNISGDNAIANFDDNLQDLRMAALEAVVGFQKKEGKPFDEFWDTIGFNKYMKTCLWNLKNKKGARITKRYGLTKNTVDIIHYEEVLLADDHDASSYTVDDFLGEKANSFSDFEKDIIKTVDHEPHHVKPNGKINVKRLSETMEVPASKIRRVLGKILNKLNLEL